LISSSSKISSGTNIEALACDEFAVEDNKAGSATENDLTIKLPYVSKNKESH
jgi:hypothetical protein